MVAIVVVGCTLSSLGLWFGLRWSDVKRDLDRELTRSREEARR